MVNTINWPTVIINSFVNIKFPFQNKKKTTLIFAEFSAMLSVYIQFAHVRAFIRFLSRRPHIHSYRAIYVSVRFCCGGDFPTWKEKGKSLSLFLQSNISRATRERNSLSLFLSTHIEGQNVGSTRLIKNVQLWVAAAEIFFYFVSLSLDEIDINKSKAWMPIIICLLKCMDLFWSRLLFVFIFIPFFDVSCLR